MTIFNAFWVEKQGDTTSHSIIQRHLADLPDGEVLIQVHYSSVNYKDALSAKGMPGVTRHYPHTPGIDASGVVAESTHSDFVPGDQVICVGFDLGMNTPGGYGEYIKVPAHWLSRLPANMSLHESMVIGTAGLTAALCVEKIAQMGAAPTDGPVLVTGATGGVGSLTVKLLAKLGYAVVASSGKADQMDFLTSLGATSVIGRQALNEINKRPMLTPQWAHAVDCVGGETLTNIIKSLHPLGSVAICGLVAAAHFNATVLPFILRGVNILGVDSVEIPIAAKTSIWEKLTNQWQLDNLENLTHEIELSQLSQVIDTIFAGKMTGRTLLVHHITRQ